MVKKVDSPNCGLCGVEDDLHHVLMECAKNIQGRELLIKSLKWNKLDVRIA